MTAGPVVLGIDQGLSGARAAVMAADGRILGVGRAECLDLRSAADGLEHRPEAWVQESVAAARQALADARVASVDAIGVGALGPAPVLLDAKLEPLGVTLLFSQDPATPFRSWIDRDPSVVDRAVWLSDACGSIVAAFVGSPVLDRITAADLEAPEGWPSLRRPEVAEPFSSAGGLSEGAAARLGLPAGTPVTVGTYDTFVDLAALGVRDPGDRGILLGSTLILGQVRGDDAAPAGLRPSLHVGDGWFVGGWTQAAGRALAWCLGLFPDDRGAAIAEEAAGLPPGAGGLLALPYLDGERAPVWDPGARGAFVGLTTSTTAADLYRATIDAVALSAADLADRLGSGTADARPWRVAGGGANHSAWLRATVDAIGEPMLVSDLSNGGGAARSAFAMLDVAIPELPTTRIEAHAERHEVYARLLPSYRELYPALASTTQALVGGAPR